MQFWQEFGLSLASDIVGTVVTITVPLVVLFVVFRRRRGTPVLRFFGLDSRAGGRICIRLSNIYVREHGTFGVTGIDLGFNGPAVTEGEYRSAERLASAVRQRPLPRGVQAFASFLGIRFVETQVECDIRSGPRYVDGEMPYAPVNGDCTCALLDGVECAHDGRDDLFCRRRQALEERPVLRARLAGAFQGKDGFGRPSFVLVGSPTYNALTHYVHVTVPEPRLDFIRVRKTLGTDVHYERGIRFRGPDGPVELMRDELHRAGVRYAYAEYLTIQKITRFGPANVTVLVCAGTCTSATVAAVRMLANWEKLLRLPGPSAGRVSRISADEEFLLVYDFQTPHREPGEESGPEITVLRYAWSASLGHWKPRPDRDD